MIELLILQLQLPRAHRYRRNTDHLDLSSRERSRIFKILFDFPSPADPQTSGFSDAKWENEYCKHLSLLKRFYVNGFCSMLRSSSICARKHQG